VKKITNNTILTELGYFVSFRKKIKKEKLPHISKEFSYLHFNNTFFPETYKKKDEILFFELIYLVSHILLKAGFIIENKIVNEIIIKNIGIYLYGSTMYEQDKGRIPSEMFDSIYEKYPQKNLIDYIFNWVTSFFEFSSFDIKLYSYVCCKSLIDSAIISSKGGLPVDNKLSGELSWGNPDDNDEIMNNDMDDAFEDLFGSEEELDDLYDNELNKIDQINEYLARVNSSDSVATRRKLFKEAIEKFPDCVELRLFSANEYTSLNKKIKIYDETLELAKKQIGSEEYFKELEEEKAFWGVVKTRPYMCALFEKAETLYCYERYGQAADIWRRMLELCPNDNLGVRTYLLEFLLYIEEWEAAKKLLFSYPECILPDFIWTNIMLKLESGQINEAKSLIEQAVKMNKHISKLLLNKKKYLPDFPDTVTFGSKHEAELYCGRFKTFWSKENLEKLKTILAELYM